jgi:AcrR family transcriptional regulator
VSTRDRLIEAAIGILEAEGEAGIRVDRVAAAAGFTKPVVYAHFVDREDVIAVAQAERYRRSIAVGYDDTKAMIVAASTSEEFLAGMRRLLAAWSAPDGQERRRFRIDVLGSAVSRPALMASVVAANRALADQIEMPMRLAEARGWLNPGVPIRDFTHWWVGLMLSRFMFEIDPDGFDGASWDALTDQVLRHVVMGSGSEPPG